MSDDRRGFAVLQSTDHFVRRVIEEAKTLDPDFAVGLYKLFLLGAVGTLKETGRPVPHIAALLREYADLIEQPGPPN